MKTAIEKLGAMVESERLARSAADLLDELGGAREWADALTEIADAVEASKDAVESWIEASGRDEKADARQEVLDLLQQLSAAVAGLDDLAPLEGIVERTEP